MIEETIGWINDKKIISYRISEEGIKCLIGSLQHPKVRTRWSAADQLGKIGHNQAVDALIISLQDEHWLVRLHAAKALGRIGNPRAIPELLSSLKDKNSSVRRRAAIALGNFKEERVLNGLSQAANDPDKYVRICAITGLSTIGTDHAAKVIANRIRDNNRNVAWRAAEALGIMGKVSVDALLPLLTDPSKDVRYMTIKTLGRIGDGKAIDKLRAIRKDVDQDLQHRIEIALSQIKYWGSFSTNQ